MISVQGPMSGFDVTVGFTSSNWKNYDDQLKADEKSMASSNPDSTGATAGTGKWWVYKQGGTDQVLSVVKSNGDKALRCTPNNTVVKPEVIAACKTLRAYPK